MQPDAIVRSIDVGYGNTKYVMFRTQGQDAQCALFPSIAPQAGNGGDLTGGVFQRRNTVVVDVAGVRYEVGKDAMLAKDASYGRILDQGYSLTDTYMALVRGAIAYMGVDRIDVLMLGLPVNTYEANHQKVAERMVGEHTVPLLDGSGSRTVRVEQVRVLPQPIGGFFDYAIRNNLYGRMRSEMNLLIDPGYFTLDWVVAQGVKMVDARSGAHNGGMSAILATLAEAVGRDMGAQIPDPAVLDTALRNGTNPRFFGKERDISEHIKVAKEKARQFVAVLANRVGNKGMDIDNIILAGGGAAFFKEIVQEQFPHHDLIVTDEPVFANVRGFQLAGEQYAKSEAFLAARAAREATV